MRPVLLGMAESGPWTAVVEAKSVKKRMKDKAFARAVSRDDLRQGADELGLPLDEHITNVITFMRPHAEALGLEGSR